MRTLYESERARTTYRAAVIVTAVVAVLCQGSLCHAQESGPSFDLHGYGQLSELKDAAAPGSGSEADYDVSLLGVWRIHQDLGAWLQLAHYSDTHKTRVEWAFLDWSLSGTSSVRLGQVRLPMGMLNESRDVQALRNSVGLPLMYEDRHALVDEALRGVILEQRGDASKTGEFIAEYYASGAMVADESRGVGSRIVGGRLQWTPPSSAWNFAASAYAGRQALADAVPATWRARYVAVVSAKCHAADWDFTGEFGASRFAANSIRTGYLQGDRQFGSHWAIFTRADSVRQHDTEAVTGDRHDRLSAGLAWRPSLNWGLRLEAGANHAPAVISSAVASRSRWSDFAASVNFYL